MLKRIFQSQNSNLEYTNKMATRQYGKGRKTRLNTEICTSTEFCTQYRKDLEYTTYAQVKWNLKQLYLELFRFYCP